MNGISNVPKPTPRPKDPNAFVATPGPYSNLAYGDIHLCLYHNNVTSGAHCASASEIPGLIDPDVPTFLGRINKGVVNLLKLAHFDGNVFNASMALSKVRVARRYVLSSFTHALSSAHAGRDIPH